MEPPLLRPESPRYRSPVDSADWVATVTEIAQLAHRDDENALALGDRLVRLEQRYGAECLRLAADQAGITWSCLYGRYRVARAFPPEHSVRRLPLTFSHLRALIDVPDTLLWARKATESQWSTRRLHAELELALGRQAQAGGERCRECRSPLGEAWVALQRAGERRVRCCSPACGLHYLGGRSGRPDPFA